MQYAVVRPTSYMLHIKELNQPRLQGFFRVADVKNGVYYFGGARSKGFATLRNESKLPFFDEIGHLKSVGFRFYSAL